MSLPLLTSTIDTDVFLETLILNVPDSWVYFMISACIFKGNREPSSLDSSSSSSSSWTLSWTSSELFLFELDFSSAKSSYTTQS